MAQESLVDLFGKGGHGPLLVGKNQGQLFAGQDLVFLIGLNLKMGRQKIQNLIKNLPGTKMFFFILASSLP